MPEEKTLIPLDDALARLLAAVTPLARTEDLDLLDADGRVLAQDVISELQVPPYACAAMDGYALRVADVPASGAALAVTQRIAAGQTGAPLAAGSAARIFTGAPLPPGADAVVMQEDAQSLDGGARVQIAARPKAGQHVRPAGEDVARGAVILHRGERLRAASLGLAASGGLARVAVAAPPRVALLCTGDELVAPGSIAPRDLPPGRIYDSNRFFLRALLARLGCQVSDLGELPDRLDATVAALDQAAQTHDLILTSGGVSVGEEDHVKPAVQRLGRLDVWQIAIKPGKPFAFGQLPRASGGGVCYFAGLPGNPVAGFITFLLLVRPLLLKLQGAARLDPLALPLRADFDWPRPGKRREFLRVRRNAAGGLDLYPNQGSAVLAALHWADGLVDLPAGQTLAQGAVARYLPLAELLA
ncbi:MAG: molybdopterin molybdotransferase MoeA [Burkholderiaceae bacterium]|jgi:molybdopterin molybdotransferase|nr:molybdopterin molybdotransferase MoeA [Burkholderiaceae bacterium]